MAAITSAGSGNWSATGTWVGGVVPTSADTVTIASGHTVTLDKVGCAALSMSLTGSLFASETASSSLSVQTTLTINSGGDLKCDVSGNIGVVCTLILNNAGATADSLIASNNSNRLHLKGFNRNRRAVTIGALAVGATSAVVSDATNWQVGDVIVFGSTTQASALASEAVTLNSVSGTTIGWAIGTTYSYQDNCYVANMTSNMVVKTGDVSQQSYGTRIKLACQSEPSTKIKDFEQVQFIGMASSYLGGLFYDTLYWRTDSPNLLKNCAFYNGWGTQISCSGGYFTRLSIDGCVFWSSKDHTTASYNNHLRITGNFALPIKNCSFFRASLSSGAGSSAFGDYNGLGWAASIEGCLFNTGFQSPMSLGASRYCVVSDSTFVTCCANIDGGGASTKFVSCDFYTKYNHTPRSFIDNRSHCTIELDNCLLQNPSSIFSPYWISTLSVIGPPDTASVFIRNRNGSPEVQEYFTNESDTVPTFSRDIGTQYRSSSSLKFSSRSTTKRHPKTFKVGCAAGKTITIVGYIRCDADYYNLGVWNPPVVTVDGLGTDSDSFTATSACNGAWQQYTLTVTNTTAYSGEFTVTYTAYAHTSTTGNVWFDGVPDSPFVTQCRHYGFDLAQETSPTVTVDPYVVLSEAAASTLTGCTINGGTKHITFGAGTIDTASELYDYSRYWSVTNLTLDVPFSRAGSLFSLASGWTVVEPSISGITWGGGTIDWTSAGTKNGGFDSNVFDFKASGTYEFGNATLSGTLEFINTSGGAVIVNVPAGTTYTNTGPNITVNVAVDEAEALILGIVAGSRLQIYNVTTATEMVNAINATTSYTLGYPNGTGYSAGDVVRVRLTYCVGLTAKLPVEYVTIASSSGWSVLANQQDDDVYIANGIDGSTVTEYSSDYGNVQIDMSDPDGVTSIQRGYAWYCDQMTGDDGIRYFYGAFVAEDAFNYLLNTDVADIQIQNTGTTGVTLTGGALRRKDGSSPIAPGGSVYIYYGRTYGLETGVSGLTAGESSKLMSLPDADGVWSHSTRTLTAGGGGGTAPTAAENAAAVRAELTPELGRIDALPAASENATAILAALQGTTIPVDAVTGAWPTAAQNADATWGYAKP